MQMQIYKAPRYADFRELMNGMATAYGRRPAFQLRVAEGKYTYISFVELRDRFYALCSAFLRAGLAGKHIAVIGKTALNGCLPMSPPQRSALPCRWIRSCPQRMSRTS